MSLFNDSLPPKPLAERLRPSSLDQVIGQKTAVTMLNAFVEQGTMPGVVFWGPPGSGKTTMSRLMASLLGWEGRTLNATSASVKEIRELAAEARENWKQLERRTLLFIDEIHRLNKTQQDVLLPFVEAGTFTLAGSTTENPYFSLTQALRSRVQLIQLVALTPEEIVEGLERAIAGEQVAVGEGVLAWISTRVGGDLRLAYTVMESAALLAAAASTEIGLDHVSTCLRQTVVAGDRKGDNHYDLASAYQKSLRGSDDNAAVYYLARFLESGEDPRFIARRLLVTASEDVGNADPMAMVLASQAYRAVETLGLPEARIPLAQATLYVARAPKSNEAVTSISKATDYLRNNPLDPVPLHLRDAHYQGAAELGHGKNYIYSHDHPETSQTFLPESMNATFTGRKSKERLDEASLDQLYSFLLHQYGSDGWFELEAEALARSLNWPVSLVRSGLNKLVQHQKLTFKRSFKLHS